MIRFLSGAAAIALVATAAHADPGGGKGGGGGGDKGGGGKGGGGNPHAGHVQAAPNAGGGRAKAQGGRAEAQRTDKGHRADRGDRAVNSNDHGKDNGRGRGAGELKRGERADRADRADDRRSGRGRSEQAQVRHGAPDRPDRMVAGEDRRHGREVHDDRDDRRGRFDGDEFARHRLVTGCPPGLAKKNNGCVPPGLAREPQATFWDRPDWWGFGGLGDGRYTYYNGSLLRLAGDNRVLGYLPLLGGALAPGNLWPSFYDPVPVPDYYQDYYGLGPPSNYRYYDDALYELDPQTMAITSIAALLTGDDFGVGQPLPPGYDIYNVPYSYRDRYADGPDALYRYSDGYVYQVDPETRLINAAIELLT